MEIFKLKTEHDGEVFIIRPLLNIKNLKESIVSYKTVLNTITHKWDYRYMCLALINNELKIFDFSKHVYKLFSKNTENEVPSLIMMSSNKAIKIKVGVKDVGCGLKFLDNKYEIIEDDKFKFDTDEKRNYIKNLLETTDLDLSEALKILN